MILLNDFKRRWDDLGPRVLEAVSAVGQSGSFILGQELASFERSLAATWGAGHAIGTANGTDAIEIALMALGCRRSTPVLTTPLSAFATTQAIFRAGGHPVYVDVDATGSIDLNLCQEILEKDPSIRFFVPVHLYGHSLDLERLAVLRDRFGLQIVEDCAQAIGASFNGVPAGAVGQIAATSFYPTKNLGAFGDAGAVLTGSPELEQSLRRLRDSGQSAREAHEVLGMNSRLDEMQAAILRSACLPRLREWTELRRRIAARYIEALSRSDVRPVTPHAGSLSAWHLFTVTVPEGAREDFRAHMKDMGIATGVHYQHVIPEQPVMSSGLEYTLASPIPNAERFSRTTVTLPSHPYLTDAETVHVIEATLRWRKP